MAGSLHDLLGTLRSYFLIGGTGGVRLKNSSGVLAIRNAADSADAAVTASAFGGPGSLQYVDAGGTADAITAAFSPAVTALTDGLAVVVGAAYANATTTPTLNVNGLGAATIVKGNNQALAVGDIAGASAMLTLVYSATNTNWTLINPPASAGGGGSNSTMNVFNGQFFGGF